MKAQVGQYVKALHDFQTTERGEITLKRGDVLLVSGCVDENWLCGRLGVREGNFPRSFVEVLHLPTVQNGQKLYRATENFPAQVEGDLEFRKGDIILGTKRIDSNWWRGRVGEKEGMFPLTHAAELETLDDLPPENSHVFTKQRSSSEGGANQPVTRVEARALVGSTAQLDDELGFQKGETIWITEVVDADWYRGECNGQVGTFLSDCVEVLGDLTKLGVRPPQQRTRSLSRTTGMSFDNTNDSSVKSSSVSSSKRSSLPQSKTSSLDNRNRSASYNSENTRSQDNEVTPYAKTLYQFAPQAANELPFRDNEIVKLIRHVDADWIEGELDGKVGLFPASFVEIIVDCPYDFEEASNSSLQAGTEQTSSQAVHNGKSVSDVTSTSFDHSKEEQYALVLYDFSAESTKDLNLTEGDTIIVMKRIDDNWLEAKDESGNVGMCPVQFVEIIGAEPSVFENNNRNNKASTVSETSVPVCSRNGETQHQKYAQTGNNFQQATSGDIRLIHSHEKRSQTVADTKPPPPKSKPLLMPKPKPSLAPKPVFSGGKHSKSRPNSSEFSNTTPILSLDEVIKEEMFKSLDDGNRSRSSSVQSTGSSSAGSGSAVTSSMLPPSRPNGPMLPPVTTDRPKPPKPAPPLKAIVKDSAFLNKAYVSDSGQCDWGFGESKKSVGQSTFFIYSFSSSDSVQPTSSAKPVAPTRKPPAPPTRTASSDDTDIFRKPSLRKPPPPRPTGPRVASAPPKTLLTPLNLDPTQEIGTTDSSKPAIQPRRTSGSTRPSRPAPPRPAPRTSPPRTPTPVPRSPSDLMSFSPNNNSKEEQDSEAVVDLRNRIIEVEADLQKCLKSRRELEMMLSRVNEDDDRDEIEENLEFYQANISGLSSEMTKLKGDLQQLMGNGEDKTDDVLTLQQQQAAEEARQQEAAEERRRREAEEARRRAEEIQERRRKRENVIEELLQTEKDYLLYLQLCVDSFLSAVAEKSPAMDREVLFGNMEEIADVAQKLLTAMEGCISGKDFSEQVVGGCFVTLAEDMKNAYAPYCRNHDDVHVLLEKYEEIPAIQEYVEQILDQIRQKVNVFDFGSLLIKPVQRILKYPLLLNELLKTTEDNHPDKTQLMSAINAMTDVATAINEYKRRKDLVFKYKKETDEKFGDKIAKLNFHSLKKKSTRLRARLSTNLGIGLQTKDETFHKHEARFRAMEKVVKTFGRDVQTYLEQIQESVMLQESVAADITDYYDDKRGVQEIEKYQSAVNTLSTQLFTDFKSLVEKLVVAPLNSLVAMFEAPSKVIQKRFDKLLDYDSLYKKVKEVDKSRVAKEALQAAKNDYEAMNAQLLDELPKLHQLSFSLLRDCMGVFVRAQRDFTDNLLNGMYPLLELPMLLSSGENILETFNIKHIPVFDRISNFSFVPRGFNPRVEPNKPEKRSKRHSLDPTMLRSPVTPPSSSLPTIPSGTAPSPQSPSQKVFVQQSYPPDKTYRVIHGYTALNVMDLSLCEGDVVGVIKTSDPMGDKGRWFVDNGEAKGFVPQKFLTLFSTSSPRALDFSGEVKQVTSKDEPLDLGDEILGPSLGEELMGRSLGAELMGTSIGEEFLGAGLQVDWSAGSRPPLPVETPSDPPPPYPDEFYCAEYAFTARNPNEVSLFEGQVVSVISKTDLDGNAEWWWVDADGHQGFAPAAYLSKIEEKAG